MLLIGGLAGILTGCDYEPVVKEHKDLTGDGIDDITVTVSTTIGTDVSNWLFIGQKDGGFKRAKERNPSGGKESYFKLNDTVTYFWDGEFYRPSFPKK